MTPAPRHQLERCATQHRRILLRIARSFAADADREDLLQEVLVALWHALPGFAGRAAESTFVYRVALNTALAFRRGQPRGETALDALAEPADAGGEPPELVELAQREQAFEQALAALPRIDRSIVLMQLDGLAYRDIGEVLGINESAVGARLTRARRRLSLSIEGGSV